MKNKRFEDLDEPLPPRDLELIEWAASELREDLSRNEMAPPRNKIGDAFQAARRSGVSWLPHEGEYITLESLKQVGRACRAWLEPAAKEAPSEPEQRPVTSSLREEFLVFDIPQFPGPFRPDPNTREEARSVVGEYGGKVYRRVISDWVADDGEPAETKAEAAGLRREVESLTRQRDAWQQKEAERCKALARERAEVDTYARNMQRLRKERDAIKADRDQERYAHVEAEQVRTNLIVAQDRDIARLQAFREALTGPVGVEAALGVAHESPMNLCNAGSDTCDTRPEVQRMVAAAVEAAAREAGLDHA